MVRHVKSASGKKGGTSANTKSADGESSEANPAHPDSPTAIKEEIPAGAEGSGEEEVKEKECGNDAGSASAAAALEEASAAQTNTTETTTEADVSDAAGSENMEPKQAPGPDDDTATKAKEDEEKQGSGTPPVALEIKTELKATEDGKQNTASPAEAAAAKRKTEATEQPGASGAVGKEEGGTLETKKVVGDTSKARAGEKRPGEDDSSDDDGDGFRIVVGRVAPAPAAPAPAAPAKRFLRGTNSLVNAITTIGAGNGDSRSTPSSKPVSAAAGIASLVPSKGAPVAAARPSLKPGEYPPTAELQQSNGKTAFDVDIDGMEEQPWRHSGVDIADFFNYGFTEESWRVYCEKQLRNRYDQTLGRSKNTSIMGGRGGGGNYMRHGGTSGSRRGGDSQRPIQLHSSGPERSNFPSQGLAGNGWGGGAAPERFAHGFGSGSLPGGRAHASSPPWFDGPPQQMRSGNRQNFGPGPAGVQDGGGSLMRNSNGGVDASAGGRRSLSPDPRGGPSDKRARMR